jgi:2-polyprenyl-3-methyl-5-hydroxy-6-metoxy-1,4-benzoquinol methylase
MRGFAIRWKIDITRRYQSSNTQIALLDFGCGTGSFLHRCAREGWKIAGVEPSNQARTIANTNLSNAVVNSVDQIDGKFDVITLWHVLEHIPDLSETFQTLKGKLAERGTLIIAVPNFESYDAKYYRHHWAGYDVPRHLWHFNQNVMQTFVSKNGCKIVETIPMKLDAYYVSMLSETYILGKRNASTFLRGFITGLKSNISARKNSEYSSLIYIIKRND